MLAKCAVSIGAFTGQSKSALGLAPPGNSFRQPGASLVADPQLHENSGLCGAGVGLSSPLVLASQRERARQRSVPSSQESPWPSQAPGSEESELQAMWSPPGTWKRLRPWAPAVPPGPVHLCSLWPLPLLAPCKFHFLKAFP